MMIMTASARRRLTCQSCSISCATFIELYTHYDPLQPVLEETEWVNGSMNMYRPLNTWHKSSTIRWPDKGDLTSQRWTFAQCLSAIEAW